MNEMGKFNRRTFLALSGAVVGLAAGGARAFAQGDQMIMATGGGKIEDTYRATIFGPWKQKTGFEIITTGNEGARLKAMVEQGKTEWDILQGPAEEVIVYARQGLLEQIDGSKLDAANMVDGSVHPNFILTDFAAYSVAWNTDSVTANPPQSWKDLWSLDGRIGLWKKPYQTLEAALLADGVELKNLYPLDIDRAFASLEKIKSNIVWWAKGAQGAQMLIDGEVDAGAIWNGRVYDPKKNGAPVDFQFNQAILVSDAWAIPKGAPNKEKAMDFIAFGASAQAQAEFSKNIPYGPANKAALGLLDDTVKASLPIPGADNVILNLEYWADNGGAVTEKFNKWLLS